MLLAHSGCPQRHTTSIRPAFPSQCALQYFELSLGTQVQTGLAHFFALAMVPPFHPPWDRPGANGRCSGACSRPKHSTETEEIADPFSPEIQLQNWVQAGLLGNVGETCCLLPEARRGSVEQFLGFAPANSGLRGIQVLETFASRGSETHLCLIEKGHVVA
jgi:hypothetical protein